VRLCASRRLLVYDIHLDMPISYLQENPYTGQSDEELAELSRKKDELAFQELMHRYMRHIFNFSRQYSKTAEDAEDIAQDTFFKVWKYIGRYTKGRQFRPWLYTIARNTALDFLKKKKAAVFSDLDDNDNDLQFADTLEDPEPLTPELLDKAAMADTVNGALKELHPDHRAVLLLHYREEMTFDEIALVVNRPMNTVKSWHRRALFKLRDILSATHHNK
jgi:RNA polymerase sigma-70 factor, ECF subfamily